MRWFISFFLIVAISFSCMGEDSLTNSLLADTSSQMDSLTVDTLAKKETIAATKPKAIEGKLRAVENRGVYFFLGLAVFLLFGLVRFAYQKYMDALFTTLARSTLWRLSANERLWQSLSQRIFFLAIYFLSAGYILGRCIHVYGQTAFSEFWTWILGVALVLGAFITKYLILQSVALVFRFNKLAKAFFRHLMVINQVLGIILLPFCGILLVLPGKMALVLLIITLLLLAISMIFKYLVNLAYVRNLPKVNYVHFIVYLCTLEFIPLAVLMRYAYDGFGV